MKDSSITYKIYFCFLLIIIAVGTVLRLWDLQNIQFMHDELSALFRLQYNNLSDVIKYGVIEGDNHPAGVQVFLYYWTMLFGFSEIAVKMPFMLAGIVSVLLVYYIGKLWFDEIAGIFSAIMLASTQFFVMFSQTARPYVSGLFLTLLMVYFWSLYFFKKKKNVYLILYVIFSALSAYNHHFSLLFAAIVGVTGIFLIDRKSLIPYSLAGIAIFILYIPHLPIFFAQLGKGGIGYWLAKPEPTFLFDFIAYLLHYSYYLVFVFIVVVMLLFWGSKNHFQRQLSKRIILFIWFLLPITIGYLYSVFVNPVVQYSMLIFSTPYLYIAVFSFHRKVSQKLATALMIVLLVTNILTLVLQRDHYRIYYHQPYEELFSQALENNYDVTIIDECVDYYHEYYFEKFGKSVPYISKKYIDEDLCIFDSLVSQIKTDYVVTHSLSGEELLIVEQYFPYQINYKDGFTYEIYTFSRVDDPKSKSNCNVLAFNDLFSETGNWKNINKNIVEDTAGNRFYYMNNKEWGPAVEIDFDTLEILTAGIVDFSATIMMPDTVDKLLLVISVFDEDNKSISWRGKSFLDYCPEKGVWQKLYVSSDLHGIILKNGYPKKSKLKANIWNASKKPVYIKDMKVSVRPLNNDRYNLY